MNDYIIRQVTPDDAEAVIAYLKQIGGESDNLSFGPEGLPLTLEGEREFLATNMKDPYNLFLGVWKDGVMVGDGSLSTFPRRFKHRAELGIAVIKSEWHNGVGTMIMEKLIAHAKAHEIELINLEVRSDNVHAIHLYEKFGFVRYGVSPAFFKIDGKYYDADEMVLDLR